MSQSAKGEELCSRSPSLGRLSCGIFAHLVRSMCPFGTGLVGWLSLVTKTEALHTCTTSPHKVCVFHSWFPQDFVIRLAFTKMKLAKMK